MKRSWLLLALACVVIGGCGQTGPLYLPDQEEEVVGVTPAGTATEADAEAERKRNEEQRQPAPQ
jgi:predicted small lipoprotein YifL